VVAAAIQGGHFFRANSKASVPHLAQSIPENIAGWSGRDVPLGTNEFLSGEVEKVLNYDEVVNREFTRDSVTFGVYVAYWGAGKMPTQLVASHTPDRCWTENGWHCLAMKFRQPEALDGAALEPAEWRLFEPPSGGAPVYVLYWHLVGGRLYDYGRRFNAIPSPLLWWKGAVQQVLLGSGEQYFIRLTSSEPLENLWSDPGFDEVLRSLRRLGLAVERPTATPS
jgi:hypothetical protein